MVSGANAPVAYSQCAKHELRRCFLSLCFFPRTQVWPKPPLCASWVRRPRQDASSTCSSQPLPACMRSLHHLRTCSGTVLRNLPSVQWFVSAQVLQHALATAPGRLQPISVPALATHAPTTARPLFIEPIHRTVLRYTFLPFSPFSSVFSLQMPELLAVFNEPNSLPHLVPGTPPFLSLLLPPPFCPYSHEDRKL